jgi:hypothetical protein
MSQEYQIWEMLAGVGKYTDFTKISDLTDESIIEQFRIFPKDYTFLVKAIQMRDAGLLEMKDGRIILNNCYENPEVVKKNFPMGSKQIYNSPTSSYYRPLDVSVCGYAYVKDRDVPNLIIFAVVCREDNNRWANEILIHPNRFIQ